MFCNGVYVQDLFATEALDQDGQCGAVADARLEFGHNNISLSQV